MVNGQPEDPLTVMKRIVDRSWSVSFPVYVSESAVDVIRKLLERRSVKRLGNLRRRAEDVFDHPWLTDARFDWAGLRDGTLKPKPLALSENFEKQRARRIAQLERSLKGAAADARVSEEEAAAADAVFADF
jgi:cGMP-dependent protein kinase 2